MLCYGYRKNIQIPDGEFLYFLLNAPSDKNVTSHHCQNDLLMFNEYLLNCLKL